MNLQLLTWRLPPALHMDSNKLFHLSSIQHTISNTTTPYTLLQSLPPTHLNKVPMQHTMPLMKELIKMYPTTTPTIITTIQLPPTPMNMTILTVNTMMTGITILSVDTMMTDMKILNQNLLLPNPAIFIHM